MACVTASLLGLSFETLATETSHVGNYAITPKITNTNYNLIPTAGNLIVNRAENIIWIGEDAAWFEANNWNQGVVPDKTQRVSIDNSMVSLNGKTVDSIKSLTLSETKFYLEGGRLIVNENVNVQKQSIFDLGDKTQQGFLSANKFILENSRLSGNGTLKAQVENVSGTSASGRSPGKITVDGNYTQGKDASLLIEVAGIDENQYDQLSINGLANLNGTIDVSAIEGYQFTGNENFNFIQANEIKGNFSQILAPSEIKNKLIFKDGKLMTNSKPEMEFANLEPEIREILKSPLQQVINGLQPENEITEKEKEKEKGKKKTADNKEINIVDKTDNQKPLPLCK